MHAINSGLQFILHNSYEQDDPSFKLVVPNSKESTEGSYWLRTRRGDVLTFYQVFKIIYQTPIMYLTNNLLKGGFPVNLNLLTLMVNWRHCIFLLSTTTQCKPSALIIIWHQIRIRIKIMVTIYTSLK